MTTTLQERAQQWRKAHEMNGQEPDSWWDIWGNAARFDAELAQLLAQVEAQARLGAIEEFGVMLAEAELGCGHSHTQTFQQLSAMRERLRQQEGAEGEK